CHPGGPPTPFTGDDHIGPPALVPPDPDRLQLAARPDRLREPGKGRLIELLARLIRVPVEVLHRALHRGLALAHPLPAGGRRGGVRRRRPRPATDPDADAFGHVRRARPHQLVKLPHLRQPPSAPRRPAPRAVPPPRRRGTALSSPQPLAACTGPPACA